MYRTVLIIVLTLLAAPTAAQSAETCKGELWRKVQTWLKPGKTFQDTVAFLHAQNIDYTVFDARTAPDGDVSDAQFAAGTDGATDCQPQKKAPQCAIVMSEPTAESRSQSASPTFVESDELIAIDFDAKGKQTGHSCEVVQTGM